MSKDKDDLAEALAALAAGEHVEPEADDARERDEQGEEQYQARPPTPKPIAPKPTSGLRPASRKPGSAPVASPSARAPVARSEIPAGAVRPRPVTPGAATDEISPPTKARPAAPTSQVDPPVIPAPARPDTPQSCEPSPPEPFVTNEPEFVSQEPRDTPVAQEGGDWIGPAPEDDDAMLAPAPDPSVFIAHPLSYKSSATRGAKGPGARQTMVPILLTSGVLLIVFGLLKFLVGPDSPFAAVPPWISYMAFIMGAVLLGVGVMTAMQLKAQLERDATRAKKEPA